MEPSEKVNRTSSRKSDHIMGMTASQIAILSGLGCFVLVLFGALAELTLSNTNSFPKIQPLAPIGHPTSSLPTSAPQLPTKVVDNYIVGTWQDNIFSCTITIKILDGSYQITRLYSDGSRETKTLNVEAVGGIERLIEYPNSQYGDYMVILNNGNLAFYDNEGFIYEVYPK